MITVYKSVAGGLLTVPIENLDHGCWINMVSPSADELALIAEKTGITLDFLSSALDDEERSRIEIEENQMLILVDIPILKNNQDYDTLPLAIIATTDYIVTVCLTVNAVLADFTAHTARSFNTYKKTRFLFQILYKSALLYIRYIRNINRRTDELERHLRKSMDNDELYKLLDMEKSLTYFSTSLRANFNVTERLLRLRSANQVQHLIKMYEEDEDLLEDVIIEYRQAIEMVEIYSHILNGMLDVFASIISNNLNLVMRFLASVTIILAVPTMLSSFWGMNVPVPFTDYEHGFLIVVLLAFVLAGSGTYFLWKKRML